MSLLAARIYSRYLTREFCAARPRRVGSRVPWATVDSASGGA